MKFLILMLVPLFFSCGDNETHYPLLHIPPAYRSPSGEKGQILLSGTCTMVKFFHGESDDEADWHWFIDINPTVENDLFLSIKNEAIEDIELKDLDNMYAELMLVSSHNSTWFDEFFYPLDVDLAFMFKAENDEHPFYNLALPEITENQGTPSTDLSLNSELVSKNAYIYLQGPFVNDAEHDIRPEIHPLDAIAFAMNENGNPLSVTIADDDKWPSEKIIWRVGFFSNSDYHRINNETYLQKARTTTWYLDLPKNAYDSFKSPIINVQEQRRKLWLIEENQVYTELGLKMGPIYEVAIDPKDGKKKLKVTATMEIPDKYGGIVITDYTIDVNFGPSELLPPPNTK